MEAGCWESESVVIQNYLADAHPVSPEIAWAWRQLEAHDGVIRIADIATALGWSRKRLAAGFREHVGVTPKMLGRVLRFHRAQGMLGDGDAVQVAAACGYADQAHMIREFRAIGGWTPKTMPPQGWPEADGLKAP